MIVSNDKIHVGVEMKIKLDKNLVHKLRCKVNEYHDFSFNKIASFQFPNGNRWELKEDNAFNCICAAMDRIDDLVEHINSLNLTQSKEGVFALCDFLNYSQTLIDCIKKIAKIYNVDLKSNNDCTIFGEAGDGKGTDDKYFKYLRSLCAIHPVGTTGYPEYQGEQAEWCAYVDFSSSAAFRTRCSLEDGLKSADFIAVVYRNDTKYDKVIPIRVTQLFEYLDQRYKIIEKIIDGIEDYNKNKIEELKSTPIKQPSEFTNYIEYLENLENEIYTRNGDHSYKAREWKALFLTHFDNNTEMILQQYTQFVKQCIVRIHDGLQNMSCIDKSFSFDLYDDSALGNFERTYSYQLQKMLYLYPSAQLSYQECDYAFVNKQSDIDEDRIEQMLREVGDKLSENTNSANALNICNNVNVKFKVNDSEWARLQLKVLEPILGKYIEFDYMLNDWKLYVQYELAKWLLYKDLTSNAS